MYYSLANQNFNRFPGLLEPLLASHPVQFMLQLMTWTTLGWELLFPFLVVFRRTRWLALLIGVGVHAGIGAFVMVGSFSLAIMWTYLSFIEPDQLARFWERRVVRADRQPLSDQAS